MKESIKSNKRINPVDRITDRILAAWNGSFQPISAQRRNQTPAIGIAQGSLKDRSRIAQGSLKDRFIGKDQSIIQTGLDLGFQCDI